MPRAGNGPLRIERAVTTPGRLRYVKKISEFLKPAWTRANTPSPLTLPRRHVACYVSVACVWLDTHRNLIPSRLLLVR
jgi:hypothetical protein